MAMDFVKLYEKRLLFGDIKTLRNAESDRTLMYFGLLVFFIACGLDLEVCLLIPINISVTCNNG